MLWDLHTQCMHYIILPRVHNYALSILVIELYRNPNIHLATWWTTNLKNCHFYHRQDYEKLFNEIRCLHVYSTWYLDKKYLFLQRTTKWWDINFDFKNLELHMYTVCMFNFVAWKVLFQTKLNTHQSNYDIAYKDGICGCIYIIFVQKINVWTLDTN